MPQFDLQPRNRISVHDQKRPMISGLIEVVVAIFALWFLSASLSPAAAASLSRSVDVEGTPSAVWSMIGPFCAIKDWLPPVGTCTESGKVPPTRTLVTRDGKATFVEIQTARSDTRHFYAYTFRSSPLPVTHYMSTIEVTAKAEGLSTVTWRAAYTPQRGKEKDAHDALAGIYDAGLTTIKAKFTSTRRSSTRRTGNTSRRQVLALITMAGVVL